MWLRRTVQIVIENLSIIKIILLIRFGDVIKLQDR